MLWDQVGRGLVS